MLWDLLLSVYFNDSIQSSPETIKPINMVLIYEVNNTYQQISLDAILTPYRFLYFLYCIIYNGLFAIVAFCFFPIFVPLLNLDKMDQNKKLFYYYICLCLITVIITISYTISVREDLGYETMRQHTRYYALLFIPFFICFLNWAENAVLPDKDKKLKFVMISLIISCLIFTILSSIRLGAGIDTTLLKWWNDFCKATNENLMIVSEGGGFSFNLSSILLKTCFICFVIFGVWGICRYKKIAFYCITSIIFALFIFDDFSNTETFRKNYTAPKETALELSGLNDFMMDSGGNCLYIMSNMGDTLEDKLVDTYIYYPNMYMTVESSVTDTTIENLLDNHNPESLKTFTNTSSEEDLILSLDSVDYILLRPNSEFIPDNDKFEYLELEGEYPYKLYISPDIMELETNGILDYSF